MARKAQAPKMTPAARSSTPDDDALDSGELDLQDLDSELGGFLSEAQRTRGSRHLSSDELSYS